jgi:hypothetical protein
VRRRRPGSRVLSLVLLGFVVTGCSAEASISPQPLVAGLSSTVVSPPPAHLVAVPPAGKVGGEVRLSGRGYPAGSRVVFTFHGRQVGDATTDAAGGFAEVVITVPEGFRDSPAGTQFVIGATSGPFSAETPFVLTR